MELNTFPTTMRVLMVSMVSVVASAPVPGQLVTDAENHVAHMKHGRLRTCLRILARKMKIAQSLLD